MEIKEHFFKDANTDDVNNQPTAASFENDNFFF